MYIIEDEHQYFCRIPAYLLYVLLVTYIKIAQRRVGKRGGGSHAPSGPCVGVRTLLDIFVSSLILINLKLQSFVVRFHLSKNNQNLTMYLNWHFNYVNTFVDGYQCNYSSHQQFFLLGFPAIFTNQEQLLPEANLT